MTPEGNCPTCGRSLEPRRRASRRAHDHATPGAAPWHFKLLIVAAVAYLVWRFYQLFFG